MKVFVAIIALLALCGFKLPDWLQPKSSGAYTFCLERGIKSELPHNMVLEECINRHSDNLEPADIGVLRYRIDNIYSVSAYFCYANAENKSKTHKIIYLKAVTDDEETVYMPYAFPGGAVNLMVFRDDRPFTVEDCAISILEIKGVKIDRNF